MKATLIFTLMMVWSSILLAQKTDKKIVDHTIETAISLELDGLVLDQTRSRIGRDFYERFYAQWTSAAVPTNGSDILIEEQPTRGRLGFLEIKVNDTVVAAYHLQPREEWMETAAKEAVGRVTHYFNNMEQMQKALESKDQAGSGIF